MSVDTSKLGKLTAETMEAISERYSDEFQVRTAAVIVEVDSEKTGQLVVKCTDDRPWIISAFLSEAVDSVEALRGELREATDDDD